jgi:extradiol dioxygenase family protein
MLFITGIFINDIQKLKFYSHVLSCQGQKKREAEVEIDTFFIKLICMNVASQYDSDGLDNLHGTAQSRKIVT